MMSMKNTKRILLALSVLFTLAASKAEAQSPNTDRDIENLKQQQYVPPSNSPNSVQIGVPQVYYYYSSPYPAAAYGTSPTFGPSNNQNKPGFWNNKSPIPGQYVPYSNSPNSVNIGTPNYSYPYGY